MPTLTEVLDNLYTTTWQNMKSTVMDNIFEATPFWFWLKAHDGLEKAEGGRFLTEPLRFAKSDNVTFVKKGSSVPLADKEFLTVAVDYWRYMADSIVRFGVDDQQNRGKNEIINLMKAKLQNSEDSLVDTLETRLAGTAGADQFLGLQDLVPDDPTASVALHGINGATDTWWRSKTKNMTGVSFGANGVAEMNKMVNNCSRNRTQDTPNIIITGQVPFEYYWNETLEQRRVVNKTMGDAGFQNIEFRGIPLVWSPAISTRMYFLNVKFLKFKYDPMMNFDMTEWKPIPAQINDRAAQIVLAGNLMTGRRLCHGVMHTIDTV